MAIIAVAGRKGGIGKSTIAGNLVAELTDIGWHVVAIDADPQHSLAAWAAQGSGVLSRSVEKVKDGDTDMRAKVKSLETVADHIIIDTPPGIMETTFRAALLADLMLLPCGASPLDLFALKDSLSLALRARAERRSKKRNSRFCRAFVAQSTPPTPTRYGHSAHPSDSAASPSIAR